MATRTVVCPDCDEPLTYGRLSCQSCGSLLASVAGAPRRVEPLRRVAVEEPAWLSDDNDLGWVVDEGPASPDALGEPEPDLVGVSVDDLLREQPHELEPEPDAGPEAAPVAIAPSEVAADPASADAEPSGTEPRPAVDAIAAEPIAAELATAEPTAAESTAAEPTAAEPMTDEPTAAVPVTAEPTAAESTAAEPTPAEPTAAEPMTAEPMVSEPERTEESGQEVTAQPEVVDEPAPTVAASPVVEAQAQVPDAEDPEPLADTEAVPEPEASPDVEPPPDGDVPPVTAEPTMPGSVEPQAPSSSDPEPDATVGAPADLDDAAEPPPAADTRSRALGRWSPADLIATDAPAPAPASQLPDSTPVLRPSFAGRTRLDLSAEPAVRPRPEAGPPEADQAPAEAGLPAGSWLPPAVEPTATVRAQPAPARTAAAGPRPGEAPFLADLPFDAPNDLAGWLVTAGGAIAAAGFLLPWADVVPFTRDLGYTSRWGLAAPSHGMVLLASVVVLAMALVPNRLPAWFRTGLVPLALGGLLIGLVWPYVLGGIGSHIGSITVAVAGALLLVGGGLAVRAKAAGGGPSGPLNRTG